MYEKSKHINPPQSKEEAYCRMVFAAHYPGEDKSVAVWEGGCRAASAAWGSAT